MAIRPDRMAGLWTGEKLAGMGTPRFSSGRCLRVFVGVAACFSLLTTNLRGSHFASAQSTSSPTNSLASASGSEGSEGAANGAATGSVNGAAEGAAGAGNRQLPSPGILSGSPATAGGSANLQGQKPRIVFERMRHDFGSIFRGQKVSHAFEFTNKGNGELHVRSIHAACGCVNTRVEPKDSFLPGEKGRIAFDFDSTHFSDRLVRTLTVDTNAPAPSTLTLTFTAQIDEEIAATPSLVSLGEVNKEFSQEIVIGVRPRTRARGDDSVPPGLATAALTADVREKVMQGTGPLRALAVTTSSPTMNAEVIEEEGAQKVKIKFLGNLPIGPFRERVTIWNSSRHLKELIIPVVGEVVGHVQQSTKYVEFGVVAEPKSVRRSVSLRSDAKSFKVDAVNIELRPSDALKGVRSEDFIKYIVESVDKGVNLHFDMRYPSGFSPNAGSVNASGLFIVRTNDQDYKEIRVPFFGVLRQEKSN